MKMLVVYEEKRRWNPDIMEICEWNDGTFHIFQNGKPWNECFQTFEEAEQYMFDCNKTFGYNKLFIF